MVIYYPPDQVRPNSDRPTAITNVLVTTAGSSSTGEISLGAPTCSARTRRGRWALYPSGEEVVVAWPGGALTGSSAEVAGELNRLEGDRHDDLDRGAVWAIRQFLTDPAPMPLGGRRPGRGPGPPQLPATGSAAPPTSPAITPRPPGRVRQHRPLRSPCPTSARSRPQHEPPDRNPAASRPPLPAGRFHAEARSELTT